MSKSRLVVKTKKKSQFVPLHFSKEDLPSLPDRRPFLRKKQREFYAFSLASFQNFLKEQFLGLFRESVQPQSLTTSFCLCLYNFFFFLRVKLSPVDQD
jgi:hypothetical protein